MDNTLMKLKLLARTESTLLRLQAQRTGKQIVFLAVAVGMVLLTVVMLNVGTFELLAEYVGKAYSAFIMAAANALLATVLVVLALTLKPGREDSDHMTETLLTLRIAGQPNEAVCLQLVLSLSSHDPRQLLMWS